MGRFGHFLVIFDPFSPLWGTSGPQCSTGPPKKPISVKSVNPLGSHLDTIFGILGVLFFSIFLDTFWNLKMRKRSPKGLQNGGLNGSKIALLGDLPEVSWIWYLLYGSHMGLSRGAPGRHPKSGPNPEPLPNPLFPHFGRIWGSIGEPIWLQFGSFFMSGFLCDFCSRFLGG